MLRKLLVGVSLFALSALTLLAQDSRGGITGRVTDPSGAIVPGAKVAATNTQTNEIRRVVTNDTGYYEINFLEPSTSLLSKTISEHFREVYSR